MICKGFAEKEGDLRYCREDAGWEKRGVGESASRRETFGDRCRSGKGPEIQRE